MSNSADEMNLLGELQGIPAGNVGLSHGISTCGSVKQTAAFSANMIVLLSSPNHFSVFSSSPNTQSDFLASKMKGKKDYYKLQSAFLLSSLCGCTDNSWRSAK